MIFFTTGEKIKNLRKKFGMRQQELENENLTRAFISMIETGKRGLSKDTARVIAEKINNKAIKLGMSLNIDEEYLLRSPGEDAEIYCVEKLNGIPTIDEIDVIIDIAKKYNLLKVEARAYRTLGDYYFDNKDYINASIDYILSVDTFKDTDDRSLLGYLYNRLGLCRSEQSEYTRAAAFFDRANYYSTIHKNRNIEKSSLYNIAKVYKELSSFDKALNSIDKYLLLCDKKNEFSNYIHANILKANCYSSKGNIDKSLLIYMSLINEFEDEDELLWYIYTNLGLVYMEQENYEISLRFFDKAEKVGEVKIKKKLADTYAHKSRVYMKMKAYDEVLNYVNKSIKLASEVNEPDIIPEGYRILTELYTELNDFQSLKNTYMKLLELLKNKEQFKETVNRIYNKLALLYLEQNDVEMCKKYLRMSI